MVSEKIRILLIKRRMTMSELADKMETTPQNLSNKLNRDNFTEKEMKTMSAALGCKLDITFTIDETGEQL
ncbi:MAG: helix-turn-helix transcriptional regulator [Eubacteriales bacterium]|nr:helix-turn-helix transcriptional regulator [Eubacteriales bacterium]MDD3504430.1 helix-turn-helix transcriptional regulator [Eubacteriales bacterium]